MLTIMLGMSHDFNCPDTGYAVVSQEGVNSYTSLSVSSYPSVHSHVTGRETVSSPLSICTDKTAGKRAVTSSSDGLVSKEKTDSSAVSGSMEVTAGRVFSGVVCPLPFSAPSCEALFLEVPSCAEFSLEGLPAVLFPEALSCSES